MSKGHKDSVLVDSPCSNGGSFPSQAEIQHKKSFSGNITLVKPVIFGDSSRIKLHTDDLIPQSSYHKYISADECFNVVNEELECSIVYKVPLPPKKVTTAKVIFSDKTEDGDFTIDSTVSGKVLITVLDQETQQFVRVIEGEVHQIVSFAQNKLGGPWDHFHVDYCRKCVKYTTEGKFSLVARIKSQLTTSETKLRANGNCCDCCCDGCCDNCCDCNCDACVIQ